MQDQPQICEIYLTALAPCSSSSCFDRIPAAKPVGLPDTEATLIACVSSGWRFWPTGVWERDGSIEEQSAAAAAAVFRCQQGREEHPEERSPLPPPATHHRFFFAATAAACVQHQQARLPQHRAAANGHSLPRLPRACDCACAAAPPPSAQAPQRPPPQDPSAAAAPRPRPPLPSRLRPRPSHPPAIRRRHCVRRIPHLRLHALPRVLPPNLQHPPPALPVPGCGRASSPQSPTPYPSIRAAAAVAIADRVLQPTLPEITLPAAFARVPVPSAADPYLRSLAVAPVGDPGASSVAAFLAGLLVASIALGVPSHPQPQMEGSNVDPVNDRLSHRQSHSAIYSLLQKRQRSLCIKSITWTAKSSEKIYINTKKEKLDCLCWIYESGWSSSSSGDGIIWQSNSAGTTAMISHLVAFTCWSPNPKCSFATLSIPSTTLMLIVDLQLPSINYGWFLFCMIMPGEQLVADTCFLQNFLITFLAWMPYEMASNRIVFSLIVLDVRSSDFYLALWSVVTKVSLHQRSAWENILFFFRWTKVQS